MGTRTIPRSRLVTNKRGFFQFRMLPRETRVLNKLARMQRLSRSEVLRRALECYTREALSFDEYRSYYPVGKDT